MKRVVPSRQIGVFGRFGHGISGSIGIEPFQEITVTDPCSVFKRGRVKSNLNIFIREMVGFGLFGR